MTRRETLAALACTAACLACGAGERPPDVGPVSRVLLVTFDTARADRFGSYGSERGLTPTVDRLAKQGVVFEVALAPTPITLPSHASILTGVLPPSHGVRDNGIFALGAEATLLPEVLREAGWRTAAFVGSEILGSEFGLDQGFEVYDEPPPALVDGGGVQRSADAVVSAANRWLDGVRDTDRFFLWVHFYDPHAPYTPPEPWSRRHPDPYDAEIAFCDAQLERLLGFLERRGLADGLLVAVTADHGESLGEHGEKTHGMLLTRAALRVPLVLSGPAVAGSAGARVTHPVSPADLAPTLLSLAGLPASAMPDVRVPTLLPDGRPGGGPPDRAVYAETLLPYHSNGWHAARAIVWRGHKLVRGRRAAVYAADGDPAEGTDLAGTRRALLREMEERLDRALEEHAPLGWADAREVDAAERERLAALGYVIGPAAGDPFAPELPDPGDHLEDLNVFAEAEELIQRWNEHLYLPPAQAAWQEQKREAESRALLERARALLREVQARSPRDRRLPPLLGNVESELGNFEAGLPLLELAVANEPGAAVNHLSLGVAYARSGRAGEGLREIYRAIDLDPAQPAPFFWLADHHEERGEPGLAAWWLTELLKRLEPGSDPFVAASDRRERVARELRRTGGEVTPPGDFSPPAWPPS